MLQADCVDNDTVLDGEPVNPTDLCSKRYGFFWFQISLMVSHF